MLVEGLLAMTITEGVKGPGIGYKMWLLSRVKPPQPFSKDCDDNGRC